ncbi:3-isopropylmalate dehydratase small subunit [Candidatus Carsonella ruddii]|uniref:3-isopropylmalate dehydratase n=1 Tax=Carsonella ruddii TaxID=114186 RepID=A0A2K8K9I8_CARRU|nr:3-isopropylmalate dehydratase small subunit [Candidatus Carsonella ruddii]ATX33523.1 3-isopropylmalate dehydratase small subunit [Candidatus Carsonella ruddii]
MKLISNYIYLNIDNIDTDIIIPKQFLNTLKKNGFEKCLFFDLRYFINNNNLLLNNDFNLNKKKTKVLISKKNFGCGSSREHAVWALKNFGFKIIISESFSDIFYDNSMKNNLFLIEFTKKQIEKILNYNYIYFNIEKQYIKFDKLYYYFLINKLYKNIFINKFLLTDFILRKKKEIIYYLNKC